MAVPAAARSWVVLVATLALALLTARLGWWQLDRAGQKTALQQALQQQRERPPLTAAELARTAEEARLQEHRAVQLRGRWLDQHTVMLDNRQMAGRPGFFVLTPLAIETGSVVLVQRGWVPRDLQDRTRVRLPPAPDGEQALQGRVALRAARLYEFDGAATGPLRQNLDLDAFRQETGLPLLPLVLVQEDPVPATARDGGLSPPGPRVPAGPPPASQGDTAAGRVARDAPQEPSAGERLTPAEAQAAAGLVLPGLGPAGTDGLWRQWPAPAADVHKHYGYAFQWFALCALTLGLWVWFRWLRPRRRVPSGVVHEDA